AVAQLVREGQVAAGRGHELARLVGIPVLAARLVDADSTGHDRGPGPVVEDCPDLLDVLTGGHQRDQQPRPPPTDRQPVERKGRGAEIAAGELDVSGAPVVAHGSALSSWRRSWSSAFQQRRTRFTSHSLPSFVLSLRW